MTAKEYMTAKEMIEKLQAIDPNTIIKVWDPFNEKPTVEIFMHKENDGSLLICSLNLGELI